MHEKHTTSIPQFPPSALVPSLPPPPPQSVRLSYMRGPNVTITLHHPTSKPHLLPMKMPERLLHLYLPSTLLSKSLTTDPSTGAKTLTLFPQSSPPSSSPTSPSSSPATTTTEIDIPALTLLFNHLKGLMCTNAPWNVLPATPTLHHCILALRACEILHLSAGAQTLAAKLMGMVYGTELSADDVRDLWLAFGRQEEWMRAVARSIARRSVWGGGLRDGEFIEWFLVSGEVPWRERVGMTEAIKRMREECEREAGRGNGVRSRRSGKRRRSKVELLLWKGRRAACSAC
ncbi:hypothetical protein BU24DRAFT_463727 [Aaosphaeria arxii CBS 175.79]|uniref:Uncharacterized protein n=1 Tax=Aaosphaeria arxii CBS 175.79 TaxID=1450172 RepID=A0A6A5XQG5_9PLEO|nr:uncharacterized protein BU24DRAFT_463727 [Aaosphaeria arxii CBS 175.79]KAF2015001.1 hypothetical protein BU24DRAFT_463727 [Aaosphaeria arxii CBS 175.79]